MPPKPTVTKQEILAAAVQLVREGGLGNVNARSLAQALGCSTQPLFRVYTSMEALRTDLKEELDRLYDAFMAQRMTEENRLLSQAIAYVAFARQEKHIFNALFMNLTMAGASLEDILKAPWNRASIENAAKTANLPLEQAERLFIHVWLYSHGIATQIVSNCIHLPGEQVEALLEEAFWRLAGQDKVEPVC